MNDSLKEKERIAIQRLKAFAMMKTQKSICVPTARKRYMSLFSGKRRKNEFPIAVTKYRFGDD